LPSAVAGLIFLFFGKMTNTRYISMALPALMVGVVFLLVAISKPSGEKSGAVVVSLGADGKEVKSRDFFVRPFVSDFGETGISFDGGKYPIVDHRLPRIEFGKVDKIRRLQVAMLTDWTKPECRKTYHFIHDLYANGDGNNLPGMDLYLLPTYDSERGKSLHEAALSVHFGSNRSGSYPDILAGLCAGTLSPDHEAVRERVLEIDPDLGARWESLAVNMTDRFHFAFQLASNQLAHGEIRLKQGTLPQLVAFDSVLIGQPTEESLAEFLRTASARQHSYLTTPEGANPVVIDRSCNCLDPSHNHSHPQSLSETPSTQDAIGIESEPPASSDQIQDIPPNN
jgi:hypothetical protein